MLLEQDVKETYTNRISNDFSWFDNNFTQSINQSYNDFWEKPYYVKLVSISDDNFALFKTEEFFVSKIGLKKNLNVGIRISKSAIKMLFESLGKREEPFNIREITEIEAKIINSFNEYVYDNFKSCLSIPSKKYIEEPNEVNLIFYVINESKIIGKYIITLPKDVLDITQTENDNSFFDINNFLKTSTQVDIHVGSTKMSLNDLKQLGSEDIVLLDNSNLNLMTLKIDNFQKKFSVTPDPTLIMNLEDNGDNEIMDSSTISQNMWDNIQVEIGAEFDKIKINLGELKQISEGLVVDIGSVYENKIFLKVENKNIAEGELVIINDRYGVKINKLLKEEDIQEENTQQNTSAPVQNETGNSEQQNSEDDFDYSDFEIEDENI